MAKCFAAGTDGYGRKHCSWVLQKYESHQLNIVIEHDLDVIRNADYIIDMGPGGGDACRRLVACGTPEEIKANANSITGRFL